MTDNLDDISPENAAEIAREFRAKFDLATALGYAPRTGSCDVWVPPSDVQLMEDAAACIAELSAAEVGGINRSNLPEHLRRSIEMASEAHSNLATWMAARDALPFWRISQRRWYNEEIQKALQVWREAEEFVHFIRIEAFTVKPTQ